MEQHQAAVALEMEAYRQIAGAADRNLPYFERELDVSVNARGGEMVFSGEPENIRMAMEAVEALSGLSKRGRAVDPTSVRYALALSRTGELCRLTELIDEIVAITHRGRPVRCRTMGQRAYVNAVRDHELTFAVGPAGTGKTYLAMAMAVVALREKEVERIVLTRPAVEAGEKLGFLPGDLSQKVDPYLRPLYDALFELAGPEACQRMQERGALEIAPLAYMRGRTLADAFIILDEAQNTTCEQMKMFLTRLGAHSRAVVTGDDTQTDLPYGKASGLMEALDVLADIPEIAIVHLTSDDVVRHDLVRAIVDAYAKRAPRAERTPRASIPDAARRDNPLNADDTGDAARAVSGASYAGDGDSRADSASGSDDTRA